MEVLVGPTFTIEVSSSSSSSPPPPSYPREHLPSADPEDHTVPSCLLRRPASSDADSSESSSSIGTPDDSDNDLSLSKDDAQGDEEEVQSKFHGLGSLEALEDSLPIKRGLSSHFDGKSKSFTNLSQITSVKDLKKQENPFNKRRRLLVASKLSRRSAFYSWSNPKSMPLLPVEEDEDDEDNGYGYEEEKAREVPSPSSLSSPRENRHENPVQLRQSRVPESYAARMRLRLGSMKARSFSLADLQTHDEAEEEEDEDEAYD